MGDRGAAGRWGEVGSDSAAAVPPYEAQVVLDHVKAAMPDLAENRAQDAQILFGYVRGACKELGGKMMGTLGL